MHNRFTPKRLTCTHTLKVTMSDCTVPAAVTALSPGSVVYGFTMATVILFPVVVLAFLFRFLALRESFTLLRKRERSMLYMSVLGTFTFWSTTVLYDIIGSENFPCALFALLVYLGCPFTGGPILVKTLRYSSRVALQKLRENPALDLQADSSWRTIAAHIKFTLAPRSCTREEKIMNAKFSQTRSFWILWVMATFVPYFVAYFIKLLVTPQWSQGCSGCDLDMTDCIILIVINSFNIVLAIVGLASHTRSKRDPLRIFRECLWALAMPLCLFNLALALYWAMDLGRVDDNDRFRFRSLTLIAPLACVYMQTLHQVIVARVLKIRNLTSDRLDLEDRLRDVRADKDLRRDFQQYLYSELSGETLHFLDSVDAFRAKDSAQLSSEAMAIYNRFIDRHCAPEEINLPFAVRNAIAVAISQQPTAPTLFDQAYADVKTNLLQDGFARYIHKISVKFGSAINITTKQVEC